MHLDDLRYHFKQRPFLMNRMTQPGEGFLDADVVHQREFNALVQAAHDALDNNTATGLVVWGEPGIGKSHLLARLDKWGADGNAWIVFLQNIHASPEHISSYIVKCAVSQLTRGQREQFAATPLYKMMLGLIRNLAVGEPKLAYPTFRRFADDLTEKYADHSATDWKILKVLWAFFRSSFHTIDKPADGATARLAVRWLSGDRLDAAELEQIALGSTVIEEDIESENEQSREEVALRIFVVLTELARGSGKPFVLCLDQVDVLDDARMRAIATFMHILLDSSRNLLTVFCGVQEMLLGHVQRQTIVGADWDRICQGEAIQLPRLKGEDTRKILQKRMENFIEPLQQLPEVRERLLRDGLFPLGERWLAERLQELNDPRPRQAIKWAHNRWLEQERRLAEMGPQRWLQSWADGSGIDAPVKTVTVQITRELLAELIDRKIDDRIAEHCSRLELDPSILPADASNLIGLIASSLERSRIEAVFGIDGIVSPNPPKPNTRPVYDRIVKLKASAHDKPKSVGIVAIGTNDKTSMAWALRRLLEDKMPPDRVLILTDQRQPLDLGSKGNDYHERLFGRGSNGRYAKLELDLRAVVMLDALQKVIGDARSGDLEIDLPDGTSRTLTESDVVASHIRKNRYAGHPFFQRLLSKSEPSPKQAPDEEIAVNSFDDDELRKFIRGQLALTMGMTCSGLAARFIEERRLAVADAVEVRAAFITVAKQLHKEKLLHATPCDDDLSLLL